MSVPAFPIGVVPGVVFGVLALPAPHALSTSSVALIMTTEARASHERLPVPVPVIFDSPLYKHYEVRSLHPSPHMRRIGIRRHQCLRWQCTGSDWITRYSPTLDEVLDRGSYEYAHDAG